MSKVQSTAKKVVPVEELVNLNVSEYIKEKINITDNEREQNLQLKKLCNFIETEIISKLHCATTKFSHESFDIDNPDFKGPVNYINQTLKEELETIFSQCNESVINSLFILLAKCVFLGEEKVSTKSKTISNTIAHQIWIQILSNIFQGIFYKKDSQDRTVYGQSANHRKNVIAKSPAIGNSLVWISKQQHYNIDDKEIQCPEYVELWLENFLDSLTSSDASLDIQIQSIKLLNRVLESITENKESLDKENISAKIPVESFITLIAILNNEDIVSQLKEKGLYDDLAKDYESIKSLLFDPSTNVLQFKESYSVLFQILYQYLLSDPNYNSDAADHSDYNRDVLDEFLNVIILTLAKDPSVYDEWISLYKQYQPTNVLLTNTIVNEIKDQQAEFSENEEQNPTDNVWKELDNDELRNALNEIVEVNKGKDSEIDEMNKNIKSILGEPVVVEYDDLTLDVEDKEDELDATERTVHENEPETEIIKETEPEIEPEEEPETGINVYFEKPYDWNNEIYAYVYTDYSTEEEEIPPVFIKEWPGERIYPIGDEGDIYVYNLPKEYFDGGYSRILFSDGNTQVTDVLKEGFKLVRNALYNETGFDSIGKSINSTQGKTKNNVLIFGNYLPIYYKPKESWKNGPVFAHFKIDDGEWTEAPGQKMSPILNGEEYVLFVKANADQEITVAFNNGYEWDNNYGQDFKVEGLSDEVLIATI